MARQRATSVSAIRAWSRAVRASCRRVGSACDGGRAAAQHQGRDSCNQAAVEIAPASLSTITGDSKYSIEGSAPRRSRIPARQAAS